MTDEHFYFQRHFLHDRLKVVLQEEDGKSQTFELGRKHGVEMVPGVRGQIVRELQQHDGWWRGIVGDGTVVCIYRKLDIFRKFPQFERLGAQDRVADTEQFVFDFKGRVAPCFPESGHGREFPRHERGHDHITDVVQQSGQVGTILLFRGHGKEVRVELGQFFAHQGCTQAVGPESAH